MGKALTYEMRDVVKISNERFRISSNANTEEIEARSTEEFLSGIENNRYTSLKMQLSRKLAGALAQSADITDATAIRILQLNSISGLYEKIITNQELEVSSLTKNNIETITQ